MIKQLNTQTTYLVPTDGNTYIVTLTRIHNDVNGNPRYEAIVTCYVDMLNNKSANAYRYRFTGHYMAERQEAEWILAHHMEVMSE